MLPGDALEMLRRAELPRLTKCVLTEAKFDTKKAAKTFNIGAKYEREPVELQTFAHWSGLKGGSSEQLADGLELFALRAVIEREGPFGWLILQRRPADLTQRWPQLVNDLGDQLFLHFDETNVLINLRAERSAAFLGAWWDLHISGAIYSFDSYSESKAMAVAARAVALAGDRTLVALDD
jgi:hypothetical protein